MKLSLAQWSIVRFEGNAIIISVPGAGKTRIVQAKALAEAGRLASSPFRVACLAYTNAAAHELSRRIMPALGQSARDAVFIGTLHSFCILEVLGPNGGRLPELARGYSVITPEHPLAEEVIGQLLAREPSGADVRNFASVRRAPDGSAIATDQLPAAVIEAYWQELLIEGFIDFAGVLYYSALLLQTVPDVAAAVSASFPQIIVDEYQDTSVAQVAVLRAIARAGATRWMLIGDFNQAIFGFNGVSRAELETFATELSARRATLARTYRCPVSVVQQATNLISTPLMRSAVRAKRGIVYEYEGDVSTSIGGFLDVVAEAAIPQNRAAIIAPERWLLSDAHRVLGRRLDAAAVSPLYRFDGRSIVTDLVCATLGYAYHEDARHLVSATAALTDVLRSAAWTLQNDEAEYATLAAVDDVRQHRTGVLGLFDTAQIIVAQINQLLPEALHDRIRSVFDVAMRPSALRRSPLLGWSCDELARVECSHYSITLTTIHSAKGLEFDAVLFLGFQEGIIPRMDSGDLDEDERKAYVTITRSADLLMYAAQPGLRSRFWKKAMRAW
jgi:superfamily I DNA/RNA helicase